MFLFLADDGSGLRLTLQQVSERSGFGLSTVRRAIRAGALRASQPNGPRGRLLVVEEDLDDWLSTPAARPAPADLPETRKSPSRAERERLIGPSFDEVAIRQYASDKRSDRL